MLRTHAVPARLQAGFATYLASGFLEDHWLCEYWDGEQWRLLDAELDEPAVRASGVTFLPWDVPREQFIDGSSAWCRLRDGELDPAKIGLSVLGLTGAWFAAQSVLRDIAALNKEEMLPWDTWSVGREFAPGQGVPRHIEESLDTVARLLGGAPGVDLAQKVYNDNEWLKVTPSVLSFPNGVPTEISLSTTP